MLFLPKLLEDSPQRDIFFLILGGSGLLSSFLGILPSVAGFSADPAWLAVLLCGLPILKDAAEGLFTRFDIKADVLVSLALIAAVLIGEIFAAGEVAFIMQIGALLEELAVGRARAGIEKLARLSPSTGRVLRNGGEVIVPADELRAGDRLRVFPGESIPADGVIIAGQSSVDQSIMTGESLPVDKEPGDEVTSGTLNMFGTFDMRATGVGAESAIQRMIRLAQSADAGKARIVRLADRWATRIVVAALTCAAVTWAATGEIIRAVTVLVVFCPCALVLATPTAIMAAIGNASRRGFLVREGDALERLATVRRLAFDKTGTLTRGIPELVATRSFAPGISDAELYRLAASAESRSEHPLGKAVLRCAAVILPNLHERPLPEPENFRMMPGLGITACVEGRSVLAGNARLFATEGIVRQENAALSDTVRHFEEEGCSIILLAVDGQECGFIALSDTVRANARQSVDALRATGVTPVLMTGDNRRAAAHMGKETGIMEIHASVAPEDKLALIDWFQHNGEPVCMVGDGVNDAPALKRAAVGIAMGGAGSSIAVDAADIVLVNDEIRFLPFLLCLSRHMMQVIRLNLSFSMLLNFAALFLAVRGELGPVAGALVHNAGSVLVILNSVLLLFWTPRQKFLPEAGKSSPAGAELPAGNARGAH